MSENSSNQKRWTGLFGASLLRFRLRTTMIWVVVFCILFAWFSSCLVQQSNEAQTIQKLNEMYPIDPYVDYQPTCSIKFDYEDEEGSGEPKGPKFLRRLFGEHVFSRVTSVSFSGISVDKRLAEELLPRFKKLRSLKFDNAKPSCSLNRLTQLENLNVSRHRPFSCSAISDLRKLKSLSLPNGLSQEDTKVIAQLHDLEHLELGSDEFTNVEWAKQLKHLKVLKLAGQHINNIQGLADCKQLEELVLWDTSRIESLKPLKDLVNLKKLVFISAEIPKSLEGIESLHMLEELIVCNGLNEPHSPGFRSLAPLENLTSLRSVYLSLPDDVESIEVISELPNLEELILKGLTSTDSIEFVKPLSKLWHLWITGSRIQDLDSIQNLNSLLHIDFSDSQNLVDITALANLPQLEQIRLENCSRLASVASLEQLNNLIKLEVKGCDQLPPDSLKSVNAKYIFSDFKDP